MRYLYRPNFSGKNIKPSYYNHDSALPVYKWSYSHYHYSIEELARILVTNSMPKEKLCSKQPTCVNHNVSFVINLDTLDDYSDIRADENGVWKRKRAPIAIISVHTRSQKPAQIARRTRMKSLPHYYKLSRTYYNHSSSPDFHRIITTVYGKLHLYNVEVT